MLCLQFLNWYFIAKKLNLSTSTTSRIEQIQRIFSLFLNACSLMKAFRILEGFCSFGSLLMHICSIKFTNWIWALKMLSESLGVSIRCYYYTFFKVWFSFRLFSLFTAWFFWISFIYLCQVGQMFYDFKKSFYPKTNL